MGVGQHVQCTEVTIFCLYLDWRIKQKAKHYEIEKLFFFSPDTNAMPWKSQKDYNYLLFKWMEKLSANVSKSWWINYKEYLIEKNEEKMSNQWKCFTLIFTSFIFPPSICSFLIKTQTY